MKEQEIEESVLFFLYRNLMQFFLQEFFVGLLFIRSNDSKLMYCFNYPVSFNRLNESIRRDVLIMHIT